MEESLTVLSCHQLRSTKTTDISSTVAATCNRRQKSSKTDLTVTVTVNSSPLTSRVYILHWKTNTKFHTVIRKSYCSVRLFAVKRVPFLTLHRELRSTESPLIRHWRCIIVKRFRQLRFIRQSRGLRVAIDRRTKRSNLVSLWVGAVDRSVTRADKRPSGTEKKTRNQINGHAARSHTRRLTGAMAVRHLDDRHLDDRPGARATVPLSLTKTDGVDEIDFWTPIFVGFLSKSTFCLAGVRPCTEFSGDISPTFARIWKIIVPLISVNVSSWDRMDEIDFWNPTFFVSFGFPTLGTWGSQYPVRCEP